MIKLFKTAVILFITTSAFAQTYTVERVLDGDNIIVTTPEGKSEEIQLIGVNAPETIDSSIDVSLYFPKQEEVDDMQQFDVDMGELQKLEKEATKFLKGLIKEGQEVTLEFDVKERDKYGRLLAYVFLHDPRAMYSEKIHVEKNNSIYLFINSVMIHSGYALTMTIGPNVKYADLFQELYKDARENQRGLWKDAKEIRIDINKTHQSCEKDEDCVFIQSICSECESPRGVINKSYIKVYNDKLRLKCGNLYMEMYCDDILAETECSKGSCKAGVFNFWGE